MSALRTTVSRRAFDFEFCVRARDAVVRHLDPLLAGLQTPNGDDLHVYELSQSDAADDTWDLTLDGVAVERSKAEWHAIAGLFRDFVRRAVGSIEHGVVLHAAAVAANGRAVVCPGPSGAGKSTFVGTLARGGFEYLTDEAVAFADDSGALRTLVKPLAISGGSLAVLAEFEPMREPVLDELHLREWLIAPSRFGPIASRGEAELGVFVLPRFDPTASLALRRIRGAEAVTALARNVFGFGRNAAGELALLAGLVRRFPVWELEYGPGCGSVADAVGELLQKVSGSDR